MHRFHIFFYYFFSLSLVTTAHRLTNGNRDWKMSGRM